MLRTFTISLFFNKKALHRCYVFDFYSTSTPLLRQIMSPENDRKNVTTFMVSFMVGRTFCSGDVILPLFSKILMIGYLVCL